MNTILTPASFSELTDAVRATPHLLAIGAGTKPRLSALDVTKLSTAKLSGIVEYEYSEFTFTALAGTPVREIIAALAEKGQYLPFDPMLVDAGATLGGTVAAGVNGPGRFRFGGIRDFILGVKFVDGAGRLLRMGGKVVKNAAGFDLPKFFVGSLGRFGVMAEITCKVFPRPTSTLTLKIPASDIEAATRILIEAGNTRWEPEAVDISSTSVYLRLAAPGAALKELSNEILIRWPGEILSSEAADALWSGIREFRWAHSDGPLVKIAVTPAVVPVLYRLLGELGDVRIHISGGGNGAFVSLPASSDIMALDQKLCELGLSAMTLRGNIPLWQGIYVDTKIAHAVKNALDPEKRFPSLND